MTAATSVADVLVVLGDATSLARRPPFLIERADDAAALAAYRRCARRCSCTSRACSAGTTSTSGTRTRAPWCSWPAIATAR
ncbi:hypothetical protein ACFSVJ_07320 [Prauserella oleivorans]